MKIADLRFFSVEFKKYLLTKRVIEFGP